TGVFELNRVPAGAYRLSISYVGFQTRYVDVSVSTNSTKDLGTIQLVEAQEMLGVVSINGKKHNKFTRETSVSVSKMPLADIENPQVYNTITSSLLEEQIVTNFDDALKNAPGIDKLWESTGRGNDGAGYYSLRGFAVQPTLVNGLPALTNGSPDPANIESIEVIKGPSGTLYGSSLISYGGLINITTKRPYYDFGGSVSYTSGSYGLNRVTADVNTTLSKEKNIALRVNTAYHTQNSYQDAGFRKSFFFAPSLAYQVNDRLSFYINTEFYNGRSTNQTMLFLDRGAPLRVTNIDELGYDINRSYTGNDLYIDTPTYSFQGQMNYKLSDSWTSQTAFSRSNSKSDGYYSYLYEGTQYTTVDEGIVLNRYISKQNSETIATDIQQNFIGDFNLGTMRNRMVIGLDYLKTNVINNNSAYVSNGGIYIGNNLQEFNEEVLGITNPANYTDDSGILNQPGTDALLAGSPINPSTTEQEIFSAYASDVINILPELSA
ncbi:MAG: TonB-dependent receptor plug domain-containing protein, partial [Bacteroidota bacterium]|nr:TonB-dependent receptor plug domain-containing protein [Bacteroidota bacterium]